MNLSELINTHRGGRTYADLARDAGGAPSGERIRQMLNQPMKSFPDPPSIRGLARALKVPQQVVVLSAAESLGLDVRRPHSRLQELLPGKADALSDVQAAAVAHLVDVMVPDDAQAAIAEPSLLNARIKEEAKLLGISVPRYASRFGFDFLRAREGRIRELRPEFDRLLALADGSVTAATAIAMDEEDLDPLVVSVLLEAQQIFGLSEEAVLAWAARSGEPRLRQVRQHLDEDAEAPDPDGPEGGA